MKIGFSTMNTPAEVPLPDLARGLEARGYESLWLGEHPQIPCSRKTPYPAGGEMPREYVEMMDPLVSRAVAAAVTTELRLATSVALPLEHDIFDLAKGVSTLDRMSGGRFLFGVGVGWNEEELSYCRPIPWSHRYRALAECVTALRVLWGDDESEFHGAYFDFDPVWSYPKPVQTPHPPVLCGMAGKLGIQHAVAWADGWMPMDIGLGGVGAKVARFRGAVAAAGRPDVPITLLTWGDPPADTLLRYRDLGVERVVVGAAREGWSDPTTTYPFLDRYAALIPAVDG
jgi:probable F420-dependent oxidoreductase